MSVAALRPQVLSVYKRILRLGRTWEAKSGDSEVTKIEREYIKKEAGILFRKNKHLTDEQEIRDCIREAEARVEMGELNDQTGKLIAVSVCDVRKCLMK